MERRVLALLCVLTLAVSMLSGLKTTAATKKTEEDGLTMLTFKKFGVADGTYGVNTQTGLGFCGDYGKSMDGTLFSGNVFFSDRKEVWLHYGASADGWSGLRLRSNGDGTLVLHNSFDRADIAILDKETARVEQLTETVINLKISIQFIDMENDGDDDKDDVRLGIWFDNKLYDDQYFEIENLAAKLGSTISCYVSSEEASFKAESVELNEEKELLNPDLRQITLKNFGISDGKYQYTEEGTAKFGFEANGGYAFSLENTVFSVNIEFSSTGGADFRYGGGESAWHGLRFDVSGNRLRMCDAAYNAEEGDKIYFFDSFSAGVELLDNKFNLKLSTEFVDSDGDGKKDDVKFGVWFNNVLYGNEYIYFTDYAPEMGSNFTILGSKEAVKSSLYVESDPTVSTGIDFSLYGFSKNWNKELGEEI